MDNDYVIDEKRGFRLHKLLLLILFFLISKKIIKFASVMNFFWLSYFKLNKTNNWKGTEK